MSGTNFLFNKNISSDAEDLKRLQAQRAKLEKATYDYKTKEYTLDNLTKENAKLKQIPYQESKEKLRNDQIIQTNLNEILTEISVIHNDKEISKEELEKYKLYAEEIEKNNQNWRKESERQSLTLESLATEAEELSHQLQLNEDDLHFRKEALTKSKLDRHAFLQLKSTLDRQKHNYQMLETDYTTMKRQNDDLKNYIEGLEEERIRSDAVLMNLREETNRNEHEIQKEEFKLQDELDGQKLIVQNQERFIEEMRIEIDNLKRQNLYLKGKLDILN